MKRLLASLLVLPLAFVASARAEQLIPAGSVMQCMVSDKVSSKTTHVGDPVLCQLSRTELYGRSVFPYGAYLEGHFEDYKDPGHFVGKGWMELKFDRMVVGNDTTIPMNTRVVATSQKNRVDGDGRIHGTGHPVKDTVEWLIPVLWPIDLINLPRRGPTPVIKPETRLTVKLLDDIGIPTKQEVQHQPELVSRYNYADNTPQYEQPAAPVERGYAQPVSYVPQQQSPTIVVVQAAAPAAPTYIQQAPQVIVQPQPRIYAYPPPVAYAYPPRPYGYYPPAAYYRPY